MQKKLVLGGLVFLGIIAVFIIFFLYKKTPNSVSTNTNVIPTPVLISKGSSSTYQTTFLQILVPTAWKVQPGHFAGGEEVAIVPGNAQEGDFIPSLYITKFLNSTPELIAQQRQIYNNANFIESRGSIDGIRAIKLKGEFPFYTKNEQIIKSPLQIVVYFAEKNNSLIKVLYQYPAETPNTQTEQSFEDIIKTLKLN